VFADSWINLNMMKFIIVKNTKMAGKTKIVFFEIEDWEKDYIKKSLKGFEIKFFKEPLDEKNLSKVKNYDILSVFIYSAVDKKKLDKFTNVKLITTMSTGFDHINLEECKKKNIAVSNVPYYGENTVAEHTFALILALSRRLFGSIERTKRGSFDLKGLRGFDLKGKTIGIVGTGHIGSHVARIANGFEMDIIAYDIKKDKKLKKNYGVKYVPLDALLKKADIITLHAPLNEKTKHMLNKKNIKLMKPTALIINTARGGLIETNALANFLVKNKMAGAGIDVLEEECFIKEEMQLLSRRFAQTCDLKTLIENHILLKLDNVIITPHNAFNSKEALQRILDTTISNIKNFLKNKQQNVVL
jgi:D-lactate dehydrogenase